MLYASLPPDSVGFKGWFRGCEIEQYNETEPISLSKSLKPINISSVFPFNMIFLFFNFSWLAYSKPEKETKLIMPEVRHANVQVVTDEDLDVKVITMDLTDRIILAFRGTTSSINVRTDLRVNLVTLIGTLPNYTQQRKSILRVTQRMEKS